MDDFEQVDDHGDAPAQSSIAAPLLRALLFAALAFGIYGLIFGNLLGSDDPMADVQPTLDAPTPAVVLPTPTPAPLEVLPTTPATGTAAPTEGIASTEGTATPPAGGTVGAGITAQVIAGSTTTGEQFDAAVAALQELGYEVTESGISGNPYPQTTVFATAGEDAAAQALVAADPRFTTTADNPGNLTDQIQIHVLVGEDWPS